MSDAMAVDAHVSIESISVVGRHRKDLGDLDSLAKSIDDIGLMNPITITPGGRLVAGQRRMEACRRLGWDTVPARIVSNLEEAARLLAAERDENTERKPMLLSELASLGEALYGIHAAEAKERQRAAGRENGRGIASSGQGGSYSKEVAEVVGETLGMSRSTYSELRFAHKLAHDPDRTEDERALAVEALASMDAGTGIQTTVNRLRARLNAKREASEVKASALAAPPGWPDPSTPRVAPAAAVPAEPAMSHKSSAAAKARYDRMRELASTGHSSDQIAQELGYSGADVVRTIARKQGIAIVADQVMANTRRIDSNRVVRETAIALEGLAMGVQLVRIADLDPAEVDGWVASITASTRVLNRLVKQMLVKQMKEKTP